MENQDADNSIKITFNADFEADGTRASIADGIGDGNKQVQWTAADKISVFTNVSNYKNAEFTLTSGANTTSGTFSGTTADVSNYAGLYPYQGYVTQDASNYSVLKMVTVPSLQSATDNTFDPKAAPMIGVTSKEDHCFSFKNICAFIKITPKVDCQLITLEATGSQYLSGSVDVNYNAGIPTISYPTGSPLSNKVTLSGNIKAGNTYYISVLPQTLPAGSLKITYQSADKYLRATLNKEIELARSTYYDLSASAPSSFTSGADKYVDLGVSVLWATHNLGASRPSEAGIPYAWGEIAGQGESDDANKRNIIKNHTPVKISFAQDNYKYGDGTSYSAENYHMTKYSSYFPTVDENGQPDTKPGDNLTSLVSSDDAASVAWKDGCRMPTQAEYQELIDNCHWVHYVDGSVEGYWVYKKSSDAGHEYSSSDPRIFLPLKEYWSSTVYNTPNTGKSVCYFEKAYYLYMNASAKEVRSYDRYDGKYIRPVKAK